MMTRVTGERFYVTYRLQGDEATAQKKAEDICLEQTVEFPDELVPAGLIRDEIVGRVEEFRAGEQRNCWYSVVSYAVETAAEELTQLLNVIFGNISIKPGIRVERLDLPPVLTGQFQGPRLGRKGIRELLGVNERPLLFTALKPMGLSAVELGNLACELAMGGIDIIKDDHGLTNQVFAPFEERVARCVEGVCKANRETGGRAIYVANVTAPAHLVVERARKAKALGVGGLMVAPALTGLDTMRHLAEDDSIALPIFSHPAFQGSYVTSGENGISHYALYGQISRLAGADGVVYPNFGGRFSFSKEECQAIAQGTVDPLGGLKDSFPCPGGGMSLEKVQEMMEVYGKDVIFLVGGGLFTHGPDLRENCRYFRKLVEQR